jgi:hypothetical protein
MTQPATPISIRLDVETERRLRKLAHATGGTLSSVVREAVAAYGAAQEKEAEAATRPFDRLAHLIGVINSKPDRSERTGEKLRNVLKAKTRARRPR